MSGTQRTNTIPRASHHTPSSSNSSTVPSTQTREDALQSEINYRVKGEFVVTLTKCNGMGDLLRMIPVPAQPLSKDILDKVLNASHKLGAAEKLLALWKDRLRFSKFEEVPQLNSIKPPTLQISKDAMGPDDGGLSSMTLDSVIFEAKKNTLTQMILIKTKEVENLRDFIQSNHVAERLNLAWGQVLTTETNLISPENHAILSDSGVIGKVAQTVAAIGVSSYQKARLAKEKRTVVKKDADTEMTDADNPKSQKQLMVLVREAIKREGQSRRDRTLSGKGKRRNGKTSVKKTQRPGKRQRQQNAGKRTQPEKRPNKRLNSRKQGSKGSPRNSSS